MLNTLFPIRTKVIIPQAVDLGVDDLLELVFKEHPLRRFYETFEHAELNSLPEIDAGLRNLPESSLPARRGYGDVIAHEDEHGYLQKKGG